MIRRDDEVGDISKGENKVAAQAREEAERIIHVPGKGKPRFTPVKTLGADGIGSATGRPLGRGVEFKSVEVSHQQEPVTHGKA